MEYFITDYKIVPPPDAKCAVLEDSIMQKGRRVTAGSMQLGNYISPIDATVVALLEAAGIEILGKTKMDEFGIAGLFADALPDPSGAVSAVSLGTADFALCNDYTGSVAQQAAANGLCYIHPTYGTVSRFGLIPVVSSMDQIGILCKDPQEGFSLLSLIARYDPKDGAMFKNEHDDAREIEYEAKEENQKKSDQGAKTAANPATMAASGHKLEQMLEQSSETQDRIRIAFPRNVFFEFGGEAAVLEYVNAFDSVDIELQYFDLYAQVMQILCCAEINGNLSRYDGIKFGYRTDSFNNLQELYTKSRTEGFGADAKLAVLIGAMMLSEEYYLLHYDKAMRIRRLIKESLEFDKYDLIVMPSAAVANRDKTGSQNNAPSKHPLALHALPRLCGLPAVTMPTSDGGITLIANTRREDMLFALAK